MGFDGVSIETIASDLGMSRHRLLYYFPSKQALYRRVLDQVLDSWITSMDAFSQADSPEDAVRQYVQAKLAYTLQDPQGVRMFTQEVLSGAPRYADILRERVIPALRLDVRNFRRWARQGLVRPLDFTHLMFMIWSLTQAYADHETQFALYLGKDRLSANDYKKAAELITHMVLSALRPDSKALGQQT